MTNIVAKTHVTQDRRMLLALCDQNLLGKVFAEEDKQLDLKSEFYKGSIVSEEEAKNLIGKAFMVNAVGELSVAACMKAKKITEEPNRIKGIPYLQLVLF